MKLFFKLLGPFLLSTVVFQLITN